MTSDDEKHLREWIDHYRQQRDEMTQRVVRLEEAMRRVLMLGNEAAQRIARETLALPVSEPAPCIFGDVYDAGGRCCETHHILTEREVACEKAEAEKVLRMAARIADVGAGA